MKYGRTCREKCAQLGQCGGTDLSLPSALADLPTEEAGEASAGFPPHHTPRTTDHRPQSTRSSETLKLSSTSDQPQAIIRPTACLPHHLLHLHRGSLRCSLQDRNFPTKSDCWWLPTHSKARVSFSHRSRLRRRSVASQSWRQLLTLLDPTLCWCKPGGRFSPASPAPFPSHPSVNCLSSHHSLPQPPSLASSHPWRRLLRKLRLGKERETQALHPLLLPLATPAQTSLACCTRLLQGRGGEVKREGEKTRDVVGRRCRQAREEICQALRLARERGMVRRGRVKLGQTRQ